MNTFHERCLRYLKGAVEKRGVSVAVTNDTLVLTPDNITITCTVGSPEPRHFAFQAFPMTITAIHPVYFPDGICDWMTGVGPSVEIALISGITLWNEGVFPVLRSLSASRSQTSHLHAFELMTHHEDTEQEIFWRMYIGPLQKSGCEQPSPPAFNDLILVKTIMPLLVPHLSSPQLSWCSLFVTNCEYPKGEMLTACFRDNTIWPEGRARLHALSQEWPQKDFCALRQFLLCAPCEKKHIKKRRELRRISFRDVTPEHRRMWMKFW